MVQIIKGKGSVPLQALAENHWLAINPPGKEAGYFPRGSLGQRLALAQKNIKGKNSRNKKHFYDALLDNDCKLLKQIITVPATSFPEIIDEISRLLEKLKLTDDKVFLNELLLAFNYAGWRSKKAIPWFDSMGLHICPYCNISPIQHDHTRRFINSSVDHFYDKATYPYLSLSFFNLIPACSPCNSAYKNVRCFSIATHLHPYHDNYNREVRFTSDYIRGMTEPSVELQCRSSAAHRAKKINEDLGFVERYNHEQCKKVAVRLFDAGVEHDASWRRSQRELDLTEGEIEVAICKRNAIPYGEEAILNAAYGKLSRDLAIQNKLIADVDGLATLTTQKWSG